MDHKPFQIRGPVVASSDSHLQVLVSPSSYADLSPLQRTTRSLPFTKPSNDQQSYLLTLPAHSEESFDHLICFGATTLTVWMYFHRIFDVPLIPNYTIQ